MLPRVLRPFASSHRANSFATSSKIPSSVSDPTPSSSAASASPSDPLNDSSIDAAPVAPTPAPTEPILDPGRNDKGYRAWLAGEGSRYRYGLQGTPNWLGDTPFPMNPSFNPQPPLADEIKTRIYNSYYHNITDNKKADSDSVVIREVSSKYGVAMDRVRAIVRLKELEGAWKAEKRTLQTGLLKGMESHLGVKQVPEKWKGTEDPDRPVEQRSTGKTVFEMVDVESATDDTPVFAPLSAKVATKSKKEVKSDSIVVPASRPGRAATKFSNLDGTYKGRTLEESRFKGGKRVHKLEQK